MRCGGLWRENGKVACEMLWSPAEWKTLLLASKSLWKSSFPVCLKLSTSSWFLLREWVSPLLKGPIQFSGRSEVDLRNWNECHDVGTEYICWWRVLDNEQSSCTTILVNGAWIFWYSQNCYIWFIRGRNNLELKSKGLVRIFVPRTSTWTLT